MKQFSTFVNMILAGLIAFLLMTSNLPAAKAQGAPTPVPSPIATAAQTAIVPTAIPTLTVPLLACDSQRTVQVSGSALINVTPDRALIQLGVQSNGATTDWVQLANTIAIKKVILAIQALGIDAKDIATDLYVIEPIYENYDSLYIKGYRINNVLAVTVRDVKKTSDIIAGALKAGANQVLNVEFYTSELRKYRDQARELAVKAAREKAQALASAAGAQAGCVLSITENSWSYYNGWWYGRNQNNMTQNVIQNSAPNAGAPSTAGDEPISLGQISIKAEVSASFGLK